MSMGITAAGVTAAAAVASAGAAGYSAIKGGSGGGGGAPGSAGGYDVVQLPTYDFTEPRLRSMSDFVTNQFDALGQGKMPPWLEQLLGNVRTSMNAQNEQTYFGLPGQRYGAIPTALSAAAITGGGSGVAQRQVSRQVQNYTASAQGIDQFIASQGIQGTQETMRMAGQIGLGIPQGPPSQVVQYGGFSPQPAPNPTSAIGDLANVAGKLLQSKSGYQPQTYQPQTTSGGADNYYPLAMNPAWNYSSNPNPVSSFGLGSGASNTQRQYSF